jgi:hypothetical protein
MLRTIGRVGGLAVVGGTAGLVYLGESPLPATPALETSIGRVAYWAAKDKVAQAIYPLTKDVVQVIKDPQDPIPIDADGVTQAFMQKALLQGGVIGEGVQLTSFEKKPMGEGAGFMSSMCRVKVDTSTGESFSFILKLLPSNFTSRLFSRIVRLAESEYMFFNEQIPEKAGISAPKVFYVDWEPTSDHFVAIQEDMAPLTCRNQVDGATAEEAKVFLQELARMHAYAWNQTDAKVPWVQNFKKIDEVSGLLNNKVHLYLSLGLLSKIHTITDLYLSLSAQKLMHGIWKSDSKKLVPWVAELADKLEKQQPGTQAFRVPFEADAAMNLMMDNYPEIIAALRAPGMTAEEGGEMVLTMCHGDARLENVFFHPDTGKCTIIDFQILVAENPTRDIAYFLGQSMSVATRREHEVELLRGYYRNLIDEGVDLSNFSWKQCVLNYQFQAGCSAVIPYFWAKTAQEQIAAGMAEGAKAKTEKTLMEVAVRTFTFVLDCNFPQMANLIVAQALNAHAKEGSRFDFKVLEEQADTQGILCQKFFVQPDPVGSGGKAVAKPAAAAAAAGVEKQKGAGWLW